MENIQISAITARIDSFPTLPTVVTKVMEISADPRSSASDLMKVVSQDQSLTTTILRTANSAFFGMVKKVSSLQHAITVLGFKAVRNVVLARSVFKSFKAVGSKDQFDIRRFWEHAFVCGLSAKIIAAEFQHDKNELFVAGLIHDIGKLIIYMALPLKFAEIISMTGSSSTRTFTAEKDIIGITHDQVAMELLKKWLFPDEIVAAVGFHHNPREAGKQSQIASAIYAANLLTHIYESRNDEESSTHLKDDFFSSESLAPFLANKIERKESYLEEFQQKLTQKKEEEAGTLSILTE